MTRHILFLPALALAAGLACEAGTSSSTPSASATPEGKLCGRAYSSWVDLLQDEVKKAGVDLPPMPDKTAYVEQCVAAGFTEEQAKCLDPKWAATDAQGCAAAIGDKKPAKEALDKLFVDALKAKPEPKAKAGGDAPQEDVGKAVEDALGG